MTHKFSSELSGTELDAYVRHSCGPERNPGESDAAFRDLFGIDCARRAGLGMPIKHDIPDLDFTEMRRKQQEFELCKVILPALITSTNFDQLPIEHVSRTCEHMAAFACNVTRATLDKLDEAPK